MKSARKEYIWDSFHLFSPWTSPGVSVVKNPSANAGDVGSIPGLRRSPGGGNGNPFQYCCLGNPVDRGPKGYSL